MLLVLESVADLGEGEDGDLGQVQLLGGLGVVILLVELLEHVVQLFLETIHHLLPVPDGAEQGQCPVQLVVVYGTQPQGPSA